MLETRSRSSVFTFLLGLFVGLGGMLESSAAGEKPEKWFYAYISLHLPPEEEKGELEFGVNRFISEVLPLLKDNGYTKIVLSNYFLGSPKKFADAESPLKDNLKELVKACKALNIQIIPEVMNIGPSGTVLQDRPWLAERVPVEDVEFEVVSKDGQLFAKLKDDSNLIRFGHMNARVRRLKSEFKMNLANTKLSSAPGAGREGSALQIEIDKLDGTGFFGMNLKDIRLTPRTQYLTSVKVKTCGVKLTEDRKELGIHPELTYRTKNHTYKLYRSQFNINPNHGSFKTFSISFNSYDADSVDLNFFFDVFEGEGKIIVDDLSIRKVGGINVLTRSKSRDIKIFDKEDVKLACDEFDWKTNHLVEDGNFEHCNFAPDITLLTDKYQPGDQLFVSYFHANAPTSNPAQVCISLTAAEVDELFVEQIRMFKECMAEDPPKAWMVFIDEIRGCGHEPRECEDSPAKMVRDRLDRCVEILKSESPGAEIIVPNDMFDPFHNAGGIDRRESYYPYNNGTFFDSWENLSSIDNLTIWNWSMGPNDNFVAGIGDARASFGHFNDLREGNPIPQIVGGFYDVKFKNAKTEQEFDDLMEKRTRKNFLVAKQNGAVRGVCYYTNYRDLRHLVEFAKIADQIIGGNWACCINNFFV